MSESRTIEDLFPGVAGRMDLVRVMIKLKMPELREIPRDEVLQPELFERLQKAAMEVRNG